MHLFLRKTEPERKKVKIIEKEKTNETIAAVSEEIVNLIEFDEDLKVKQEFVDDDVEDEVLTIEKIAARRGLIDSLHELQLG